MPTPAPRIFVSHSHFDNDTCRTLVAFLKARFPDIFFDESELHGGDDWFRRIQHEVIARPIFIVVLTTNSVKADWVAEETNLALAKSVKDKSRRVIPVMVDPLLTLEQIEAFAPILTLRQIVDLSASAPQSHWDDLLHTIEGHAPVPVVPVDPARQQDLEEARDLANQVQEAVQAGYWLFAIQLARHAVTMPGNARDATLWGNYAAALLAEHEDAEAVRALDAALKLNRSRSDLWQQKARALLRQGKLDGEDGTIAAWDEAFIKTGALDGRLAILAEECDALQAADRTADVERRIRMALQVAPNDPAWQQRQHAAQITRQLAPFQARYDAAMQANDWTGAIAACDEALRIAQGDTGWQQRRSKAQTLQQREVQEKRDAAERTYQQREAQIKPLLTANVLKLQFALKRLGDTPVILPPLCSVPAGPFEMGDGQDSNAPKHTVTLGAFEIGMYPVTVAEYACAVVAGVLRAPPDAFGLNWQQMCQQRPDHPVVHVSWVNARDYAAWLAQVTGQFWRLPTEAEWEKAARGADGRIYPWGNTFDQARANTDNKVGTTTPVGAYADKGDKSPYDCHDMAGNVWEWTGSMYIATAYQSDGSREKNSDITQNRVLRGGSWGSNSWLARAAYRLSNLPDLHLNYVGVRLARALRGGSF